MFSFFILDRVELKPCNKTETANIEIINNYWSLPMFKFLTTWVFCLFLSIPVAWSAQEVPFLTYHNAPPFIVDADKQEGLTYDLARLLSDRSNGKYQFVVSLLPRKRLNIFIEKLNTCVVPWVNPAWFQDKKMNKYSWTDGFMKDSNSVISHAAKPVEYSDPESLVGMNVIGLQGGQLVNLTELIKTKKIKKVEVRSYFQALKMIAAKRGDAAIIPTSAAKHLIFQHRMKNTFHFSSTRHTQYERRFLVRGDPGILIFLQKQISFLKTSPAWQAKFAKYGLIQ
ncbi:MAG: transporter substrate-binding domain-containing protein [Magnetovibrio sp.]|nr:transporter substrate-binding domain-containing protein [Magnetovibrio sp.]